MSLQTPSSCENVNVLMMDYPAYGLQESSLLMRLYFDVRLRSEHLIAQILREINDFT